MDEQERKENRETPVYWFVKRCAKYGLIFERALDKIKDMELENQTLKARVVELELEVLRREESPI